MNEAGRSSADVRLEPDLDAYRIVEQAGVLTRALRQLEDPAKAWAIAARALHDGLLANGTWTLVISPDGRRFRVTACLPGPMPPVEELTLRDAPAVEALRAGHSLWARPAAEMAPWYGPHLGPCALQAERLAAFPVIMRGRLKAVLHTALSRKCGCSSRVGERYGTMVADLLSLVLAGQPDEGAPASAVPLERGTAAGNLGAVVHELNQPLTSILGYTELLSRKIDINATGGRYVEQLTCEVDRLVAHVERLTHLAQYRVMPYPGPAEILDIEASPPPSDD